MEVEPAVESTEPAAAPSLPAGTAGGRDREREETEMGQQDGDGEGESDNDNSDDDNSDDDNSDDDNSDDDNSDGDDSGEDEDDYEEIRRRNIERNNEKLRELQLFGMSSMAPNPTTRRKKATTEKAPVAPTRVSGRERKRSQASLRAEESEKAHEEWLHEEAESKKARRAARKNRSRVGDTCEDCMVKTPSFGFAADRKRRWCHTCAQHHSGAVLLKTRTLCEDCNMVDPSFGKQGERKRRWCHGCAVQHSGACLSLSLARARARAHAQGLALASSLSYCACACLQTPSV